MSSAEDLISKLNAIKNANEKETKSKRLQLLVTPSVYDALKSISDTTGISVNEICNIAIKEYLIGGK